MIRSDIFKDEGSNNFWLNFFQRFSTFENIQTERKETPTSDAKCSTILTNLIDFNPSIIHSCFSHFAIKSIC